MRIGTIFSKIQLQSTAPEVPTMEFISQVTSAAVMSVETQSSPMAVPKITESTSLTVSKIVLFTITLLKQMEVQAPIMGSLLIHLNQTTSVLMISPQRERHQIMECICSKEPIITVFLITSSEQTERRGAMMEFVSTPTSAIIMFPITSLERTELR